MAITLRDIAERVGVSVSTVSRVLNGKAKKYRISSETQLKVEEAALKLQYKPNTLARGLRLSKTHTIGLVVPDVANPFFATVANSIQNQAQLQGYSIAICATNEDLEMELKYIDLLLGKRVDGLIVMPVGQEFDHFKPLIGQDFPLVILDRIAEGLEVASVEVDNYAGSFSAVEHIIKMGHRNIAIIEGLRSTKVAKNRFEGFRDALFQYHLPMDENLIRGNDFRMNNGYFGTMELLDLDSPPTAIFATSNLITLGTLKAVTERGLCIPEDISLVAFDNSDLAPYLISPLTTVAQPTEQMGKVAVETLMGIINKQRRPNPRKIILQPTLIIRNSVKLLQLNNHLEAEQS